MEQRAALKILGLPGVLWDKGTQKRCQFALTCHSEVVICSILDIDMVCICRLHFAVSGGQDRAWDSLDKNLWRPYLSMLISKTQG